jgi:hypothetical protein
MLIQRIRNLRQPRAVFDLFQQFAQEALGHNSKAVHWAYAKRALMKIPSLEEYEHRLEQTLKQ